MRRIVLLYHSQVFAMLRHLVFFQSISKTAKISGLVLLLLLVGVTSGWGQTTLAAGDVALLGINATNPDQFSIILLKDITANTVINFTDNGFTAGATGRTGEGFLTYTAQSAQAAGTILTWTNGMTITGTGWSSNNPTNFAFNASGDQLFIFQGSTSNWGSQSGITLLYGINYGTALSATSGASNTVQPTALTNSYFLNLPSSTANNGYFSNTGSSATTVTVSGTPTQLLALFVTSTKWFTQSNSTGATTFPTFNITLCSSISATLSGANTICSGNATNLSVAITGGTGPYAVVYNDGSSNFTVNSYTSGANISVSPSSTKTYNLVSVTDANGCTAGTLTGTPTVTVNAGPSPTIGLNSNPNTNTIACPNPNPLVITADLTNTTTATWQRSIDNGSTWQDITAIMDNTISYNIATAGSITQSQLTISTQYVDYNNSKYRLVTSNSSCSATSSITNLTVTGCPLPIELLSFEGKAVAEKIQLRWRTATETNNAYMAVERSKDGVHFVELGRVKGHGTTLSPQAYAFVDRQPLSGINYYRLRQVDADDKVEYHKVIAVDMKLSETHNLLVYPSPTSDYLTVEIANQIEETETAVLKIYDLQGRLVRTEVLNGNQTQKQIDVSGLVNGSYIISIQTNKDESKTRFLKVSSH